MPATTAEIARDILLALIAKSGVREWEDIDKLDLMAGLAWDIANSYTGGIPGGGSMAVTAVGRTQSGTAKTLKSSGGDALLTLTSVANAGMRQSTTLDLGATRARAYRVDVAFELAATPTAGAAINLFGSWANASGAGQANTTGTDGSYTGYSSNAAAAVKQLEFLGAHICTTQATATVQSSFVGVIVPKARYLNLVVDNESGAAFHSSATNCVITLTPIEDTSEPS